MITDERETPRESVILTPGVGRRISDDVYDLDAVAWLFHEEINPHGGKPNRRIDDGYIGGDPSRGTGAPDDRLYRF